MLYIYFCIQQEPLTMDKGIVFNDLEWMVGQAFGRAAGKSCLGGIAETTRYRMLILGRDIKDINCGYRFAASWCDFDLTLDLTVMTLTFKILGGLCLKTGRCRKLIRGRNIGCGVVIVQHHHVTLI